MPSLVIRDHQLRVFKLAQARPLVSKLVDFIHRNHKPDCDEHVLTHAVENAVERGIDIGLTIESSYLAYALLKLRLGNRFDEHPAIAAVLNDGATAPDHRLERLGREITAGEWQAAARLSETGAVKRMAASVER
jgi:hypothetical protein